MSNVITRNQAICKMKTKIIFLVFSLFFYLESNAQCAMCRAVLESEETQTAAKGINDGIVYLMAIPYLLVGGLGYFIYLKYKKLKK
ncbi:conserved hypothetical protein [Mariniflexile fucanivorans]